MQTIKRWGVKKIGLVMISTSLISCGGGYRNEVLVDIFNKNKYSFNIIKEILVERSSIELVSLNAQADSVQNYCSDGVYPYEACAAALLSLKRAGVKEIRSFRRHDNSALVSIRFLMFRRGLFFWWTNGIYRLHRSERSDKIFQRSRFCITTRIIVVYCQNR